MGGVLSLAQLGFEEGPWALTWAHLPGWGSAQGLTGTLPTSSVLQCQCVTICGLGAPEGVLGDGPSCAQGCSQQQAVSWVEKPMTSPVSEAPALWSRPLRCPSFSLQSPGGSFLCQGRSRGTREEAPTTAQAAVDGGLHQVVAVEVRRRFRFAVCFEDGTNRSF